MAKKIKHTWEYELRPRSYIIRGEFINTYRPQLDGDKENCPRCQHPLFRDLNDLFCLRCGWRECAYFHDHFNIEGTYLVQRLAYNTYRLA